MDTNKVQVSATPHIRSKDSVRGIMQDVIIALMPAMIMSVYVFGFRTLLLVAVTVISSVIFEQLFQKLTKQESTINDLSAVVTGLLLAYNLPANAPLWLAIVGSFVAIIIAKQLFGGIGQNFINPALAARALLMASYPVIMTNWPESVSALFESGTYIDASTLATPLAVLKDNANLVINNADLSNAFVGTIGGALGETSSLALLIGGAYLIIKKVIKPHIPVAFIGTVFIMSYIFGRNGLYEILLGGVMLGAIFMATDYTSSPISDIGKIIMGVGCGFITVIIRNLGSYPEGVSYSILLMNLTVPLIDKYIKPRLFGEVK